MILSSLDFQPLEYKGTHQEFISKMKQFQQLSNWQTYLDLSISERTKTDLQQILWGHTTNWYFQGKKVQSEFEKFCSLVYHLDSSEQHTPQIFKVDHLETRFPNCYECGLGNLTNHLETRGSEADAISVGRGSSHMATLGKRRFLMNCQHIIVLHFKIDPWNNFSLVHKIWTKFIENMI